MLKLEFKTFWNKLDKDKFVGYLATVHCMTDVFGFTFIMKSKEKWEYYTVMSFESIRRFAQENEEDPMNAMDMFVTNYCSNTLPVLPEEIEQINTEIEEKPEEEEITKGLEIDAGDDIVNEAKDYADFLLKFFNKFEKKVLSSITQDNITKSMNKNFGEFLATLFNTVNSIAFAKHIKKFIKADMVAGLVSAEAELGIDIGFTKEYQEKLNVLAAQQLSGYTINGKLWPGIQGVSKEIQVKVIKTVQNGINDKKSVDEIKKDVGEVFDKFNDWRSEMIARTETNRISNSAQLLGYKESGLEGKKVWSSAMDNRTSDICQRLNGQEQELDDPFIDPVTRKEFQHPPALPNCRSTIFFRPK